MNDQKPFRVLSLDGGGMRGTYTATYLSSLASAFAHKRGVEGLDIGAAFDLIVGTSTGGIIACALAESLPLSNVVQLYQAHGNSIFQRRLPQSVPELVVDLLTRSRTLASGNQALSSALDVCFGDRTLGEVFHRRHIALAITAVELSQHRSWVFKTPHLRNTNHRDDNYRLVDVCLATTAAPIYRSLAAVDHPNTGVSGYRVFADGGLWANNPVLVGLIDALEMTKPDRAIEIFCLGTCPRPVGTQVLKGDVHWNLVNWKFGGVAAALSVDAQEFAYDNMARMLVKQLDRQCEIVRFPHGQLPASLMPYLDLADTRQEAMDALINQARSDADMTNSRCGDEDNRQGQLIRHLFMDSPTLAKNSDIQQ